MRKLDKAYKASDITELHLGAEYFFSTKIPLALRGGYWRDPSHSVEFRGPLLSPSAVASAILYPKGESANHISAGLGLAWPSFQIDAAYDRSPHFRVGSISMVGVISFTALGTISAPSRISVKPFPKAKSPL